MIEIPIPTPTEIEAVLFGMMDGTNAFSRWVKLDDAHLPCGGEETRVGDTMWWADVIGPDNVGCDCIGGGGTPAEAGGSGMGRSVPRRMVVGLLRSEPGGVFQQCASVSRSNQGGVSRCPASRAGRLSL